MCVVANSLSLRLIYRYSTLLRSVCCSLHRCEFRVAVGICDALGLILVLILPILVALHRRRSFLWPGIKLIIDDLKD